MGGTTGMFSTGGVNATGGSGGTGGSGTDAAATALEACPSVGQVMCGGQPSVTRPNVLIVLDRSSSTAEQPWGFATSIWDGLKSALDSALNAMKVQASYGLELYPYPVDPAKPIVYDCAQAGNCCELPADNTVNVPVEHGITGVPKILQALNTTGPGGGEPTTAALRRALAYYTTGAGSTLTGEKYVLLVTNGAPNCNTAITCDAATCTVNIDDPTAACATSGANCCADMPAGCLDDQATIQAIAELGAAGVKTFVVGLPSPDGGTSMLEILGATCAYVQLGVQQIDCRLWLWGTCDTAAGAYASKAERSSTSA